LSGAEPEDRPESTIADKYAVWQEDFEHQLRIEVASYEEWEREAGSLLGKGKPVAARYCAERISEVGSVPASIQEMFDRAIAMINPLGLVGSAVSEQDLETGDRPSS
jgi:hypothetical protein